MSDLNNKNSNKKFVVSDKDIEKAFYRINNNKTLNPIFVKNAETTKRILSELEDKSGLNDIVLPVSTAIDLWASDSPLRANDLSKVDMTILTGLIAEHYIMSADIPYMTNIINEFESKLCMVISGLYEIKGWNIYNLYKNRKDVFLNYIESEKMNVFLEESYVLIAYDINNTSFIPFNEEVPMTILDIQDMVLMKTDLSTYFESTINALKDIASGIDYSHYQKAMEEDTFEQRANERTADVLFCKHCGKKLPEGGAFCPYCGTKVDRDIIDSWGKGIPKYSEEDVMTPQDVYEFVMEFLFQKVLKKEGYDIVSSTRSMNQIPSFVLRKDDELFFLLVEGGVAPVHPELSRKRRQELIEHAIKYNAQCLYASVSIGAVDGERFEKGLALKNDAYYFRYTGLEAVIYLK